MVEVQTLVVQVAELKVKLEAIERQLEVVHQSLRLNLERNISVNDVVRRVTYFEVEVRMHAAALTAHRRQIEELVEGQQPSMASASSGAAPPPPPVNAVPPPGIEAQELSSEALWNLGIAVRAPEGWLKCAVCSTRWATRSLDLAHLRSKEHHGKMYHNQNPDGLLQNEHAPQSCGKDNSLTH